MSTFGWIALFVLAVINLLQNGTINRMRKEVDAMQIEIDALERVADFLLDARGDEE